MYKKLSTYYLTIFCSFFLFMAASAQAAPEAAKTGGYNIKDIQADLMDNSLLIVLKGESAPAYTMFELFSPPRLVIDIADANLASTINVADILPANDFASLKITTLSEEAPQITRFEITLDEGHTYKVDRVENDLSIRLFPAGPTDSAAPGDVASTTPAAPMQQKGVPQTSAQIPPPPPAPEAAGGQELASDPTLDALIDSSESALSNTNQDTGETVTAADAMQDSFEFSGYKATRISVDFYKIDIHNVFRLFRQISDINIIVDESVTGSLTLALNDVPWDFALDIILNLKNLKKEERHNTIVIYPAKMEFSWPERATDNLSFEADTDVIEQEALIIQQSTNQSAEIMQAKEFLRRAKIEEDNDDIEDAAALYEKAFKLWPQNAKISNRLAAIYLVGLRMNAKCVHYAKETLKIDKNNHQAALYAAIASANMEQIPQAMEYFAQSITGEPPLKEALISYAAFSEEKGQPEAALKLLDKYSENYSDTVDTMVAKARLYDTMGQTKKATEQYKALLYSGYQLVPGLKKYIRGRIAMTDNQIEQ